MTNEFIVLTYTKMPLFVQCSTMGAFAFGAEGTTTMAATIALEGVVVKTPEGKNNVEHQQRITYIPKSGQAEHHVIDSTDGYESTQIEHGIAETETTLQVEDGCQTNNGK